MNSLRIPSQKDVHVMVPLDDRKSMELVTPDGNLEGLWGIHCAAFSLFMAFACFLK